jgi:hypothetical protein
MLTPTTVYARCDLRATAGVDMTVRGRPESAVPERVTAETLNDVGIDLKEDRQHGRADGGRTR